MKKSKLQLTPSLMRIFLSVALVAIVAAAAIGFSFAQKQLLGFATEISRLKVDATASDTTIASLEKIEADLQSYADVSQKAQALRADDQFPEFRVIGEITKIAKRNSINVANFSYNDGDTTPAAGAAAPTPQATTTPEAATNTQSTGKTIALTVNFGTVTNYQKYLQFLYDIEQNIPKLKIKSVSVSSNAQSIPDGAEQAQGQTQPTSLFSVDPLTVELYIR